jgi:hypothetical protein
MTSDDTSRRKITGKSQVNRPAAAEALQVEMTDRCGRVNIHIEVAVAPTVAMAPVSSLTDWSDGAGLGCAGWTPSGPLTA